MNQKGLDGLTGAVNRYFFISGTFYVLDFQKYEIAGMRISQVKRGDFGE